MPAVVQVKFVVSDQEGLAKLQNWKNQVASLGSGAGGQPLQIKGISDFSGGVERATGITGAFREAVHTLHPILQSAGAEMGLLGSLARAAGGGFVALGAAALGTGLVALAKLGEQAKKTRQEIHAVYGAGADAAERRLAAQAKRTGATSEDLLSGAEAIRDIEVIRGGPRWIVNPNNPPKTGMLGGADNENAAMVALLRTRGLPDPNDAAKASAEFFQAFAEQSKARPGIDPILTTAMLSKLPRGAGNTLAGLLGGVPDVAELMREIGRGRQIGFRQIQTSLDFAGGSFTKELENQRPEDSSFFGELRARFNREMGRFSPTGSAINTAGVRVLNSPLLSSLVPVVGLPLALSGLADRGFSLNNLFGPTNAVTGRSDPLPWVQQMLQQRQGSQAQDQRHTLDITVNGNSVGSLGGNDDASLSRRVSDLVNRAIQEIAGRNNRLSTGQKPSAYD